MPEHHELIRYLADQQIDIADETEAAEPRLSPESIDGLDRELKRHRSLTPHQIAEVREGRGQRLVMGDYVLRREIGKGAQAVVYEAYNSALGRTEALKVFRTELLQELGESARRRVVDRIHQGVRAAAKLSHDNIVMTYYFDRRENFVAMEYVRGRDLGGVEVPPDTAIGYVLQAAWALEYAHREGVIHRDIKPSNLLIDEVRGQVKVTDWGLARIDHDTLEGSSVPSTYNTMPGDKLGTPHFIPPEQFEDAHTADERSDIYSLGCTLYTLITGRPIYSLSTITLTMLAHGDPDIEIPLLEGIQGASRELDEVFRKMVAKQPEHRFQSMSEVIDALRACDGAATRAPAD